VCTLLISLTVNNQRKQVAVNVGDPSSLAYKMQGLSVGFYEKSIKIN